MESEENNKVEDNVVVEELLQDENDDFMSTIKVDECALITSLVARRIVMPLVKLAIKLGLSANVVTIISAGFSLAGLSDVTTQ